MLLVQLKQRLQQQKQCNLLDLCKHLHCNPDVVRDMLAIWISKGKVQLCAKSDACGSRCQQCDPLFTEKYMWLS